MRFVSVAVWILFTSLFQHQALAQSDTMIVYDTESETIEVIPPVNFDPTIQFEQTAFSHGTLNGKVSLSLVPPTSNLFQ